MTFWKVQNLREPQECSILWFMDYQGSWQGAHPCFISSIFLLRVNHYLTLISHHHHVVPELAQTLSRRRTSEQAQEYQSKKSSSIRLFANKRNSVGSPYCKATYNDIEMGSEGARCIQICGPRNLHVTVFHLFVFLSHVYCMCLLILIWAVK
jgi:hypothetical protein